MVRDLFGSYTFQGPQSEEAILGIAEGILQRRLERMGSLGSPEASAQFLRMRLAHLAHEEFHAVWLDNRHAVLAVESLFRGTIDGAQIYSREVVKHALRWNAAAVIFSHNHPSGNAEPSAADRAITARLREALELIEVRVLDHIVVSASGTTSLAQRGWV